MEPDLVEQLGRQSLWLRDSWLWLMREKVAPGARPSGCIIAFSDTRQLQGISGLSAMRP